ncbi:MAG: hypothetical protein ACREGA_02815 [Candidatus Saccharimonadales bacterium]
METAGQVRGVRNNLHRFHGFSEGQLAKLGEKFGEPIREFPQDQNRRVQYEWYADFAYQDMGDGWLKAAIGQIIGLRLEQVADEDDLHDASQWLSEFKVPEKDYDASRIQALAAGSPDLPPEELLAKAEVNNQDPKLEQNLLKQIYQAAPELRARLNLPSKDQKLDTLFTDHASRYVYSLMARNLGNAELFDQANGSLLELAEKSFDEYYSKFITERRGKGQQTVGKTPKDELWQGIQEYLVNLNQQLPEDAGAITESISQLLEIGHNRQTYIDDTQSWLLRHATAPSAKLVKAWGDPADGAG